MTESLDQQVHRLLGLCWHETEIDVHPDLMLKRERCIKCGEWDADWADNNDPHLYGLNSYSLRLDFSWACVDWWVENASDRPLFEILRRDLCHAIFSDRNPYRHGEGLDKNPAKAICKAFIKAMDEIPVGEE